MFDRVLMLLVVVVVVVVARQDTRETTSSILPANEGEFNREGSVYHDEITYMEKEEEKKEEEEEEERNKNSENEHKTNTDKVMNVTMENEEHETSDRMIDMTEESEEHDSDKAVNMIVARPEIATVIPEDHNWRKMNLNPLENERRNRKRKPHSTRRSRKQKGRRRKWRNRHAKKYYRRNRTFRFGAKKHRKSGGLQTRQHHFTSPNQREGWTAGQAFRSIDPRRVKVRRHLVRQHNLLRSKVDPPAGDMLAMKWYRTAADQAQSWAEQCSHHNHREDPSVRWTFIYGACGQNVFTSPTKKRWTQVLQHWWGTGGDFLYGGTNNLTSVAAFTQMAWYNSHQLGCGFSQCNTTEGDTFFRYVCNYCPVGNDPARLSRPYTEGSACSLCPGSCRSLCPRRKCPLCTNACDFTDLWVNCASLNQHWHEWLCNTKTSQGVERFKNCRATCQCVNEIT